MTAALPTNLGGGELAVETRGISKRFGDQVALSDVSLQVPVGAVYLLVGPNGAGKSTSLKILLDLIRADAGTVDVFGLGSRDHAPEVRANTGYVSERTEWGYSWMRVGRLLEHHALYYPAWDADYAARLVKKFELRLDRKMGVLSKGQARRVHLTMALAHRPPLLLLDEPTDGLDPYMRDETLGVLADHLAESPATVVISTHHVEEVERLADHIAVLRDGVLRAQMSRAALDAGLRRYRVDVPEGWAGAPALDGSVLRRVTTPREVQWTVWGRDADVAKALTDAGGTVRDVAALSLLDATLALLNPNDRHQ